MPHHVAVGEVDAQRPGLAALDRLEGGVGDLRRLHPRPLLEGDVVAGDLDIALQGLVELPAPVAVPEVGHVPELLGLAAGELAHPAPSQVLTDGPVDVRRRHQEVLGDLQVPVVLHHPGVEDLRSLAPVEGVQPVVGEGAADLDRAVPAEVEEEDRGPIADGSDRRAVLHDHEPREELIGGLRVLLPEGLHRLAGAAEGPLRLAVNVSVPAALDHRPVRFVAVHGGGHPPAPGSDAVVAPVGAQLLEQSLEGLHVLEGAGLPHVPAIEEHVDPSLGHAVFGGPAEHRVQMLLVAVDVAVGEETDEVERLTALLDLGHCLLPDLALEDLPALDGQLDPLGALVVNATGPEGVVAHLAVAHVVVAGQPHRLAMGPEGDRDRPLEGGEGVEVGGSGQPDGVAFVATAETDPVHDHHQDRALDPGKRRMLRQLLHAHGPPLVPAPRNATRPRVTCERGSPRLGDG